jgi:uncharacterized protein
MLCLSVLVNPCYSREASSYPEATISYVTDVANLVSDDVEKNINKMLSDVETKTGTEVAVVTITAMSDYPDAPQGSIETFAGGLFDAWGVGNLPKNDGVLLLVSQKDRKARIELGIYYGRSRDGDVNRIMQEIIVPEFRSGDYESGISEGTIALVKVLTGLEYEVRSSWIWVLVIVMGVLCILVGVSLISKGRRGWGWVLVGLGILLVLLAIYMLISISRNSLKNDGTNVGGGFGGGSSGGGGATGSW